VFLCRLLDELVLDFGDHQSVAVPCPAPGLFWVAAERFHRATEETRMTKQTRNQPAKTVAARESRKTSKRSLSKGDNPSKLETITVLLTRPGGASLADLVIATRWQPHSVRGVLAGSLKKKGHVILSETIDGMRRYRIEPAR
jgi:hypothetical protein